MTEQMIDALFRCDPPQVKPVTATVEYQITLTPEQAHALYNDIYVVSRDHLGSPTASDRQGRLSALFSVYDALYNAGVDGAGPLPR